MTYLLHISGRNGIYTPLVEDSVVWETVRIGSPGKLTFSFIKSPLLKVEEGNGVTFQVNNQDVFKGYIFALESSRDELVRVTAYDQLRYLKNKDTYLYEDKTATDVIQHIAQNFGLQLGSVEQTGFVIKSRIRENMTLLDIIYDALDLTFMNKGKLYVLYDDFGKLSLRDIESLKVPSLVLGDSNAQDYNLKSDIDSDTFNKIKLYQPNEASGKRDIYIEYDSNTVDAWGVLQYFDSVEEGVNPQAKAETILKIKNRPSRSLQLRDCLGDVRVRAGSSVFVKVDELPIQQFMLIEKATHTFSNDEHYMTLDLRGDI